MVDVGRLAVGRDDEIAITLDELAREGARRMIATALEAAVADYIGASRTRVGRTAGGWWCATAGPGSAG